MNNREGNQRDRRTEKLTVDPAPRSRRYQWLLLCAYPNQLSLQLLLSPFQIVQYVHRRRTLHHKTGKDCGEEGSWIAFKKRYEEWSLHRP